VLVAQEEFLVPLQELEEAAESAELEALEVQLDLQEITVALAGSEEQLKAQQQERVETAVPPALEALEQ